LFKAYLAGEDQASFVDDIMVADLTNRKKRLQVMNHNNRLKWES